jgi:hypothetical protein
MVAGRGSPAYCNRARLTSASFGLMNDRCNKGTMEGALWVYSSFYASSCGRHKRSVFLLRVIISSTEQFKIFNFIYSLQRRVSRNRQHHFLLHSFFHTFAALKVLLQTLSNFPSIDALEPTSSFKSSCTTHRDLSSPFLVLLQQPESLRIRSARVYPFLARQFSCTSAFERVPLVHR